MALDTFEWWELKKCQFSVLRVITPFLRSYHIWEYSVPQWSLSETWKSASTCVCRVSYVSSEYIISCMLLALTSTIYMYGWSNFLPYIHVFPYNNSLHYTVGRVLIASIYYRTLAKEGPLRNVRPPPTLGSISCYGIVFTWICAHED